MVTFTSTESKATGIKLKNKLDKKEPTLVVKTKPRVKLGNVIVLPETNRGIKKGDLESPNDYQSAGNFHLKKFCTP